MKLKTKLGKSYLSEYKDRILSSLDRKKCTTQGEVIRETMVETVLSILAFIKVNTTDEEYYNPLVWKIVNWINYFGKWNPMVELCFRLNMLLCEKSKENISEIIQLIKDNIEDYPGRKLSWDNEIVKKDRDLATFIRSYDFLFIPNDNQKDNPGIMIRKNVKRGGMKFVDLGLPSGTLWTDRNIGATAPEEYGDYFRFGNPFPYTAYSPEYKHEDIDDAIDGTDRDAATVILGKNYRMPTFEQIIELLDECKWKWTEQNGVNGMKVTGPNDNSIFFPASGYRYYSSGSLNYVGSYGYYWSASPNSSYDGHTLYFDSDNRYWFKSFRANGLPIRAVLSSPKSLQEL